MSSTLLKLIALIFMFIDHIAEFIPGTPIWFHWIGRISAPIFFFCMTLGTNIPARLLIKVELLQSDLLYNITQFILCGVFQASFFPIYGIRFYQIINYYWLVIGSLPFILLYNGKKGSGHKYFFYFFYPLHIYILYLIGSLM